MYRQSPSRSQRSKGIKAKHVLQICLLLAVCFWLIYQVKHSHDKKKEFDESDANDFIQRASSDELIKPSRKDIHSRLEGTMSKNEKHDELAEEEDTAGEEIEENKNEEDEAEDKKVEGKEDEATEGRDDETDEREREKSDSEVDKEEDLVDDEEGEEIVENKTQETDLEDVHGRVEKEISEEDIDHDGDDRSVNEAREEHYKADDASSAVAHDTQIAATETENEHLENSNENPENILEEENKGNNDEETNEGENRKAENEHLENSNENPENILEEENKGNNNEETNEGENRKAENEHLENSNENPENILEEENKGNNDEETNEGENRKDLEVGGGEVARDGHLSNMTTSETKLDVLENSVNGSFPNNTLTEVFNDHLMLNSSSEVTTEAHGLSSQNVTGSKLELGRSQEILTKGTSAEGADFQTNASDQTNSSVVNVVRVHVSSDATGSAESKDAELHSEDFSDSLNNNTEPSVPEKVIKSEASEEAANNNQSSSDKDDEIKAGNSDVTSGTDENLDSRRTENHVDVQPDAIDVSYTSNSLEEKDDHVDRDNLPEIQTKGTNSKDVATE